MLLAFVEYGRVTGIIEAGELLEGYIDITGADPRPEVGWECDPDTGTFFAPPVTVYLKFSASKTKLVNDGIDRIAVTVRLVDTLGAKIPASRTVRLVLRGSLGQVYDLLWVSLVNGEAAFDYSTGRAPEIVHIDQKDNYQVEIGGVKYNVISLIDEGRVIEIGRNL